jgi:squalene-hopene/tetraprenyl-beta-curcumene cyclase
MRRLIASVIMTALGLGSLVAQAHAQADQKASAADRAEVSKLVDHGIAYLTGAQADDGSFSKETGPAVTALVATALLKNGRTPSDPVVAKALTYVESNVRPDGGIYAKDSKYRNYETCVAIQCFAEANKDGRYKELLDKATNYVKDQQWDEGEGIDKSNLSYGGAGYGSSNRPDLSNTSFLVDALQSVGTGPDDPAVQRMLIFVSRCQNFESEHNETKFPALNPDGGFYYTVAAGGSSPAGTTPNGGLRSYASMTYAGLKSMIFAGVDKDDPRVQAAVEWAQKNYTLEANPGMKDAGLYYYYHTFAKALATMGLDSMADDKGQQHNWKQELTEALAARQQANGSWINKNQRWMEADPNLVTAYALLALSYCK